MAKTKKPENKNMLEALQPNESSIMTLIDKAKPRLMKRASEALQHASPEKQNQFLSRTVAAIVKNEKLAPCFASHEGRVSIYLLIDDALKTGLELDRHAYAVPYPRKIGKGQNEHWITEAKFQIKRQGYHALLCGGEKPIFEDLRWGAVYQKDKSPSIDRATGEVKHSAFIGERGEFIGCWVQIIKLNGQKEAEFYPLSYINNIRDKYSKTYQKYLDKKVSKCAWVDSPIPMAEKTAIKAFCSPYADVKDELANALYSERDDFENPNVDRDNESLADKFIDEALGNMGEGNTAERNTTEDSPDDTEKGEPEVVSPDARKGKTGDKKDGSNVKDGDLF